jgi:predicted DNA-binding transcriptional regulator YafY
LSALREASRTGARLWIGYVNAEGRASQRVIDPIAVEGGYVSAFDHLREEVRTFALHRITGVRAVDEEAPA